MGNEKRLTILGHLAELKTRLLRVVIAVIITTIIAFVFADRIFSVLTHPIGETSLVYIDMTEMLGAYMVVCLTVGIFLAMPYLVYQVILYIAPALTQKEKRYVYFVLPWITFMFVGGVVFSYFVLLPPTTQFLTRFGSEVATPQIRISSYITVVTRVLLAAGIIFELPVITTFLARLGIITPAWLSSKRKTVFILAFIVGALLTPPDAVSQILLAVPLIALYEISILLARLVQKKQPKTTLDISSIYSHN